MRIGIDIRPLLENAPGGVRTYTKELAEALINLGPQHTWRLFWNSLRHPERSHASKPGGVEGPLAGLPPNTRLIKKRIPNKLLNLFLLLTGRPHLDKITDYRLPITDYQNIWISPNLNFTSLSPNCKHIQVIHDLSFIINPSWYSIKSRLWHRAIRIKKILNRADAIVAISKATAADLYRHFPDTIHKTHIIYPGVPSKPSLSPQEIQTIRKKFNLPPRFFLYIGAIEPRKNIPTLLDAFKIFKQTTSYPHALVIAGPGCHPGGTTYVGPIRSPDTQYKSGILSAFGLQDDKKPRPLGKITEKEKHALLELCEALVFPSLYEGFGLPPLEAMSHCKPVIASWSSSLPEVIHDAGLLVSPYKPHEIAHAMRMIADQENLRKDLSMRARKQAQKFTWERTAEEFLNLLMN